LISSYNLWNYQSIFYFSQEYNIPTELRKCSLWYKENNPRRLAEIKCYGDCKRILNVCNYCHKKIMIDNSHLGLGRYEVCLECKSDYLKYINSINI